ASPERLQTVEDRLARLERIKRRYGPTLADVVRRRAELREESSQLDTGVVRSTALVERVTATRAAYVSAATTLSERRRHHAGALATALEVGLADLAMSHCRFEVSFDESPTSESDWTDRGTDRAEFYFSANPGETVKPLARIASGGELSRVMLALRTITATEAPGKTLVFDEVDAGIGGEAADRVGARLRGLSRQAQVLCVTHLPQIATYGTTHYRVKKIIVNGRTTATVDRLDDEARAAEVARMMTGTRVSDTVLQTARELLEGEHQ
ncbi:MAG: DNA repair protein RecN, partial [bacterium]